MASALRSVSQFLTPLLGLISLPLAPLAAQEPVSTVGEAYKVAVPGSDAEIHMVPIPVGKDGYPKSFLMGSPDAEDGRGDDEGPQVSVELQPFYMAKFEITWDIYDAFRREYAAMKDSAIKPDGDGGEDAWLDAVSLPTPLYEQDSLPILTGMGTEGGYPVANITQFAARQFTKWLSMKTGRFYRLPTEAEWEYAARAGTTTAWSFGDDVDALGDHAVFFDNSEYDDPDKGHPDFGAGYRKVGSKQANPWGLHDMYGNVAEWVLDAYSADRYSALGKSTSGTAALLLPKEIYPCIVRGGSWESEPEDCRSAARKASDPMWQDRDPQIPKSIWWFTDGFHVGFRIVAPAGPVSKEAMRNAWELPDEGVQDIIRTSGKEARSPIGKSDG